MQFRAQVVDNGRTRTVRLAGRLGREQTADLSALCERVPGWLTLDLAELVSADPEGLEVLARLESRGAQLVGTSPYLVLQLEMAQAARARQRRNEDRLGGATERHASTTGRDDNEKEKEEE